ncbi:MAG: ATP-dependent DNA ligase [archaeon]
MLYKELAEFYEKLDSTTKRLEKTYYISKLLKKAQPEEVKILVLLSQGKIFPVWDRAKTGVSEKIVIKAISRASGASGPEIESEWKKKGDLGDVSEFLLAKHKQVSLFPKQLMVMDFYKNIRSLSLQEGKGSVDAKLALISEMLVNSSPMEAKYIVRTLVDNLRVGVGAGSVRDAIIWAFFSEKLGIRYNSTSNDIEFTGDRQGYNELVEKVQEAIDLTNDYSKVADLLKSKGMEGLQSIDLAAGKPVNPMLFQKVQNVSHAFEVVGRPAAFEVKYDGFRMQIHFANNKCRIFTRRLDDVTEQFPDVSGRIEKIDANSFIIDAEAVGYDPKTRKYLPFQSISQRIKRKYDIEEISEKFPVELNVFDILLLNGKNLLKMPFIERRKLIEKLISNEPYKIVTAKQIITGDEIIAQNFFDAALKLGQEGVMAKNLQGIYKPGSRVGFGVKIKSIMDPLDLVIVGAEYGEGKRSGSLTSFHLACHSNEEFLEIGRVSTGLKELEQEGGTTYKEMTALLKPYIKKIIGKYVEILPELIIEVGYEEIQKSPSYSSGYALRFPRFIRLRNEEKTVDGISTLEDVEEQYLMQRGRNNFKN